MEPSRPETAQTPATTAQAAGRAETPAEGPGIQAEDSAPEATIAEPGTAATLPEGPVSPGAGPTTPASDVAAPTTGTSAATTAEAATPATPAEAPTSPREPKHALGTRDNLRPVTLTPDARPGSGRHRRRSDDPDATDIIGVEDVLAAASGAAPIVRSQPRRHVQRARRSPWSRPRDKVIAVLIAVAVVAVGVTVWANSESRATISETAGPAPALPEVPAAVPAQLSELWQAPSGAAPEPIAAGKSVVTADGGELAGRDPLTGQVRWRYARDLQLCTAAEGWSRAVALFRKDGLRGETGCSEVIALDPDTGHREAQRTGSAQLGAGLVADSSYVTAFGHTLLNTWRDDLVETVEYGQVPALVNPGKQPRTGCTYGSVAMASSRVGVIERCPGDPGDRLTVYRAAPKDADQPQVSFSTLLPGVSGRLVAMSGDYVAVALADQKQLVLYGADGNEVSAYPLDLPPEDLANDPANGIPVTSSTPSTVYWFTGSKLVALSRDNLTPKWTLSSALGPGVLFDHQLVVPIQGGLAVLNEQDGSTIRTLGIDRHGYTGPVRLAAIGPVLLEQRGQTLVALR
ncbi:Rv3212 family protein [Amycolatopsis sacchari]|uniref:PQQ-like domain-containing protein n=2 Tax=Amycolatopsis TaxID=1813 RepID=A0A1I3XXX4_9PSEU|nr:PQQ-binding-like beta-propeller repeat protein [Amycolatopsis sacchari]SFK23846.1 PQQ-like domain-containing protein [Amycolatopsis sacchari]